MTGVAVPPGVEAADRPELRSRAPWPDLTWVLLDTLTLPDWQRPMGRRGAKLVQRIADGFDPAAFGVLVVAVEGDRRLLIDGQHRAAAALAVGCVSVPCLMVEGRAAARFVAVNRERLGLTPAQVWRAELEMGEPEAVELKRILDDCGLRVGQRLPAARGKARPAGVIDCVSFLRAVLRREAGPMILEAALAALAEAGQADGDWLSAKCVRPAVDLTARLFAEAGEALPEDLDLLPATFSDAPGIAEAAAERARRLGGRARDHAAQLMAAEHARQGGTEIAVGW